MKEILLIHNNIKEWRVMEGMIDNTKFEVPNQLADAYTELITGLAFAQTHYSHSHITIYLNKLVSAFHNEIYRNEREEWSCSMIFWTQGVSDAMWKERKLLPLPFIVFMVSMLIGVVSILGSESSPRLIFGNDYMDMTLENIVKGEPMGIYGTEEEGGMFVGIMLNSIMVSLSVLVSGVLASFMSGFPLFRNGIMAGCLDTFLYQHGLLGESLLATMLHDTLELSAIIMTGATGLAIDNGRLLPGAYSRPASFQRDVKEGMKIVVGIVSVFIMAGFIEGFITRHAELDNFVRIGIILVSSVFAVYYFIYPPYKRNYHPGNASRKTKGWTLSNS